jgi:hypothetical protein
MQRIYFPPNIFPTVTMLMRGTILPHLHTPPWHGA